MHRSLALALVLAGLVPGLAAAQQKTMDEYVAMLTPELRTRIERARVDFEHWPDPRGKAAAEQVLDSGEAAIPYLAMDLHEGGPKTKACAAYVAGRMGATILFRDVVDASRNEQVRPFLRDFFQAMVKLDPEESIDPLIEWLWEKDTMARHIASTFLDAMASPRMVSKLTAVLSSPRDGSREAAVKLLAAIEDPSIYAPLVAHLADQSPEVAREASDGLARHREPALLDLLDKAFGDVRERPAAFAMRTMVLIEDRHGIQVLRPEYAAKLLAWTEMADLRFVRAIGVIGLVNLGLVVEDRKVIEFLDRWSVPFLIDTIGGGVFFDEYRAVRDLCFAKLHQVTGASLGFKPDDWKTWWMGNRATFQAVRGLREGEKIDAARLEIRYEVAEPGQPRRTWYFSVGQRWGISPAEDGAAPIVLAEEEMRELLGVVEGIGFLRLDKVVGKPSERGKRVDLSVKVGNLQRRVVVNGFEDRLLEPVVRRLDALIESNRWQRYWDKRTFPAWQVWYQTYAPAWRQERDPLERNKRLKTMIVMSFEFLPAGEREEASAELLRLMEDDPELSDAGVTMVTSFARAEPGLTRTAENFVKVLAECGQMSAIRAAIDYLLAQSTAGAAPGLLNHVLEKGGFVVCHHVLRESEEKLRSAACEVMWKFEEEDVDGLLIEATKDPSLAVRRSAAYSLGLRGRPVAITTLTELAEKGEDLELRKTALVSLGRVGTEASLDTLIGALAVDDLRTAAIRGLGNTRRPEAVSPIFAVLEKFAGDPLLLKVAVDALVQIGGDEVVARFMTLAGQADRADLRLAAYRVLSAIDHPGRLEFLQGGLEDPDPEVVLEIALQMSRLGSTAGVPILIQSLGRGQRSLVCETELTRLTFRNAAGENPVEKATFYAEWWKANHGVHRRVWLLAALRDKGYPADSLVDYASGNLESKVACPLLVSVLYDDEWQLAAGASEALREITGRTDLPLLDANSTPADRTMAHLKWKAWWNSRGGR